MIGPRLQFPKVIGHRGAAQRAPENTLAGFRKAAELGCSWVEFDVRLSLDDRPAVFHDDTLDRVTDGTGRVGATPWSDLAARDAGRRFDASYRGERIPSLDEVLALLRQLGLRFDLEMKAEPGRERALAEVVARTLERAWPRELPPPLVTSFEAPALAAFARRAPHLPRGYLVEALPHDWQAQVERLEAAAVICDHHPLSPQGVAAVRRAGYPLLVYTVNHPSRAQELFGWGVDGVISDAPDAIMKVA
jgi:glycerophosphoryl diester phosphodiesterase